MKTCSKCGKEKPFSEFARSRLLFDGKTRQADGYRTMCRVCVWQHEKNRRSKWTDAEKRAYSLKQQKYSRRWDDRNPLAVKASRANLHAKRVGAKGRLRVEDVIAAWERYDGKCWVCGFPATELDHYRPINGKGGGTNTADNILPICRECNQKRSHRWHGEVIAMKEAEMLKGIKELLHGSGGRQKQIVGTESEETMKGVVIRQIGENYWTAYDNSSGRNDREGYGKTRDEAIADFQRKCSNTRRKTDE